MLTRDDIVAICPPPKRGQKRVIWDGYVEALTSPEGHRLLRSYGIDTPNRLIGFMAVVCAPETGLTVLWESDAYTPEGIVNIYGPHRHSARVKIAEARQICARTGVVSLGGGRTAPAKGYALFERVYGLGNPKMAKKLGNVAPGDGWEHRGLGLNQMTGREAQEKAARKIGCTVAALATPINCVHMACIEWEEKNCNTYADKRDWVSIRKLINGGRLDISVANINGLPQALAAVRVASRVITAADFAAPVDPVSVASDDEVDDGMPPPPSSMAKSTEGQAAVGTGVGGGWSLYQAGQNATMKAAENGDLSSWSLLMALLAEPMFWIGATTIATSVYWFLKRRQKLIWYRV